MNILQTTMHQDIQTLAQMVSVASTIDEKRDILNMLMKLSCRLHHETQERIAEARHMQVMAEIRIARLEMSQAIDTARRLGQLESEPLPRL